MIIALPRNVKVAGSNPASGIKLILKRTCFLHHQILLFRKYKKTALVCTEIFSHLLHQGFHSADNLLP